MTDVRTCALSLLDTRTCCTDGCDEPPTLAALTEDNATGYVEHLRCDRHARLLAVVATKPYRLDPLWSS